MTGFFIKDVKPGDSFFYKTYNSNLKVHTVLAVEDVGEERRKITAFYSYKDCAQEIRTQTFQRDCLYTISDACVTVFELIRTITPNNQACRFQKFISGQTVGLKR